MDPFACLVLSSFVDFFHLNKPPNIAPISSSSGTSITSATLAAAGCTTTDSGSSKSSFAGWDSSSSKSISKLGFIGCNADKGAEESTESSTGGTFCRYPISQWERAAINLALIQSWRRNFGMASIAVMNFASVSDALKRCTLKRKVERASSPTLTQSSIEGVLSSPETSRLRATLAR